MAIIASGPDGTGARSRNMRGSRVVIWLLRHGEASDDAPDDASRTLTANGERQARAAGAALKELGIEIDRCLTSPKLRAVQTARLACQPLGVEPEVSEALSGGDFDPTGLAAGRGTVMLVGHEPDLSRAIQLTTGGRADMRKGGLAALDERFLASLLQPEALRRIAGV
jgi:phosphohistidine phosphatase